MVHCVLVRSLQEQYVAIFVLRVCSVVTPFIQKFADSTPNVDFYKIDIDDFPEVAEDLEVASVPTFVMYKDNKVVGRIVGASSGKVEELVKNNI